MECPKRVGNTVTYTCVVEVGDSEREHAGPCMAPELPASVAKRRKWEGDQELKTLGVDLGPDPSLSGAQAPADVFERIGRAPVLEAFVRALVASEMPLGRLEALVATAERVAGGERPAQALRERAVRIADEVVGRLLDGARIEK